MQLHVDLQQVSRFAWSERATGQLTQFTEHHRAVAREWFTQNAAQEPAAATADAGRAPLLN
jgi:hypothetical protein